jgi:hypothetical protein
LIFASHHETSVFRFFIWGKMWFMKYLWLKLLPIGKTSRMISFFMVKSNRIIGFVPLSAYRFVGITSAD